MAEKKALGITPKEADKLTRAVKNDEVQNPLECAQDVNDPEKKKPGFVLTLYILPEGSKKMLVNFCRSDIIKPARSEFAESNEGWTGEKWMIKDNRQCLTIDAMLHPDIYKTVHSQHPHYKQLLIYTALEEIKENLGIEMDRKRMTYIETPSPSTIRPLGGQVASKGIAGVVWPSLKVDTTKQPAEPKHTSVYSTENSLQEFTSEGKSTSVNRPRILIVTIKLHGVKSAGCMDLEIFERRLTLECSDPLYKLDLALCYPVDEGKKVQAKFSKKNETITVTIPFLQPTDHEQPGLESDDCENAMILLVKDEKAVWEKFSVCISASQATETRSLTEANVLVNDQTHHQTVDGSIENHAPLSSSDASTVNPQQVNLPIHQSQTSFNRLGTVFAQYRDTNRVQQSLAITTFFKDLSLQMSQTLPDKLVQYLELSNAATRVPGIHAMMNDVLHMTDKVDMVSFLNTYLPRIPGGDRQNDAMITYLGDTIALQADLDKATHLDIKDMVNAIKKGVLNQLFQLAQRSQSDVVDREDIFHSLKKRLTSYEWICQLTCVQEKMLQLLFELGRKRCLSLCDLEDLNEIIGIDQSLEAHASIKDVLALLRCYGVIQCEQSGKKNHRVVTIKAANLSLKDVLSNPELVDLFQHSEEVRFLCTDCFYMDASMDASSNNLWAAKNIAIKTSTIHVMSDDCLIDASGAHGVSAFVVANERKANDGQTMEDYGPGDHGSHGKPGMPGKSGGNILLCTDEIIHSDRLTLRSCGGNGSDGQDGGDGQNGKAKPSESDDLSTWPNDFGQLLGSSCWNSEKKILDRLSGYRNHRLESESKGANYVYAEAPSGVRFLFGTVDDNYLPFYFSRYGFLLSKSKDGESADGGNAGTGGKGGGGGQAGNIDIINLDGNPYVNHGMAIDTHKGQDGVPGKSGKCGERAIAERKYDHLHVDGAGAFGTAETHHAYIEIKSWDRSSKTGELGSGYYYCQKCVSQKLDGGIDSDHLGFFTYSRGSHCPTKHYREAEHGKVNDQHHIVATTVSKPIDQATIHIDYQLFANQTLVLQDRATLLQNLQRLESTLHNELQELESTHEQEQHKQLRTVTRSLGPGDKLVDDVDIKPVSKGIVITEPLIPFNADKLIRVVDDSPWISHDDMSWFQSDSVTVHDKYVRIREIIQERLDTLQQQMKEEAKSESSQLEQYPAELEVKLKTSQFTHTHSGYMYLVLDAIFVPIISVIHFEQTQAIKNVYRFLNTVREQSHFQFHPQIDTIKETISPLLFKQYRWCILSEIHDKHVATVSHADPTYQSKSVTVFIKIQEQTSIKQLDSFVSSLDDKRKMIKPYNKLLPNYGTSCDEMMPLGRSTQNALELLMVFINETNSNGTVYVPDILSAVHEEYATFQCTISDPDLLFVMTYLQDKLVHLLDKTQLEDQLCDGVLSKIDDHTLRSEGYIIYKGQTYCIDTVKTQPDQQASITLKRKDSDKTWREWLKEKTHWSKAKTLHLKIQPDQVTLDDKPIEFPNDELLVCPIDIDEVWRQLHQSVMKEGRIPDDAIIEKWLSTDSFPHNVHDDSKDQLITILRQGREAQDIPYNVFSFFPPSQWVEQLILHAIQSHYQDHAPNFVADAQEAVKGVSCCVDKTLYFTFFRQFLQAFTIKNDQYSMDILESLQVMKSVFIDRHLCTLITQQGVAQAWPQSSADVTMSDLEDMRLIDSTGTFLPHVRTDTLQSFCRTRLLSPHYLNTVYTMQQYTRDLSDKELSFWSHKLHELRLRLDLLDLIGGSVDDDTCEQILMYAQQLVRQYGNEGVIKFMEALNPHKGKVIPLHLQEILEKCARKEWIFEIVIHKLKSSVPLSMTVDRLRAYDWESELKRQRDTVDIIASIKSQFVDHTGLLSAKLDDITTKVNDIKTIEKEKKHSQMTDLGTLQHLPICEFTKEDIIQWAATFREATASNKEASLDHPLLAETFAVIRRGVTLFYSTEKRETGIIPRDTQMVASLLFFQDLSVQQGAWHGTRLMQQISTGEGKTMIITMTAIFKALLGEKVDIVTSSSVLATRDAADQKPLYSLFDVSVSHCCHESLTKRRQAYESDVIYGDIGSFQRDILETDFYGRMIRTAHAYDNVFIDEVDSMLVDKGETMLYLPHALPDLNALEQVYLEIWSLVNAQDFIGFPDEQDQLHEYLKHKVFGGLPPNAFTAISNITEEQSTDIHRCCIGLGLVDRDDHSLTTKDSAVIQCQIATIDTIPPHLQPEVMLIIQQHLETVPLIETIPKPLHPFIKTSLKQWIQSAVNAKYFRHNKEYIIDIDRRESAGDRYPKIIIMDNETGVEQESSEWGSGLHQFLQLKHHLRLSTESLKAVYMSNISFFTPRYTSVMGVTGTLGSHSEHTLFNKLYENIQLVVLPTNKPSRLRINAPICCSTTESWEEAINADVQENHSQGRAVLLICEDVERARYLHQCLKNTFPQVDPELYISSHQEKLEETGDSQPGRLIIATNLAGRGTDLKLSDTVKHNGGLHVCLSYLPPNVRVEQQAYGRAARSGDPGSCKLIFHDKQGDLSYAIRKRDLCEAQRVADIEADYYHNIQFQEELFEKFRHKYDTIKDRHKDKPKGRPELDYCLDCWAYFLDRYTDVIESIPNQLTDAARELEKEQLRRAFDKEVQLELERMVLSPARLMQLGHIYMKQSVKHGNKYKDAGNKEDYEAAINAYQKASAQNPVDPFAKYYEAAAQLNRAFRNKNTTLNTGKSDRHNLKQIFYQLIPLFQEKIRQCQANMSTLQLANRHQDQFLTTGAQYFNEQKQHEMEVYHQYIASMQDIVGKDITPKTFDHADWGETGAVTVFNIAKELLAMKDCRVSPRYQLRLKALLSITPSYHTYEAKIEMRIKSLLHHQKPVTKHDFKGVFPDKQHFWDQLKRHHLITHEPVPKEDGSSGKVGQVGYWNPTVHMEGIQLELWDCIDANSFDWIQGLSDKDRQGIVRQLKTNCVLNQKGQLIELDLSKPLDLQKTYTPYYKHIKDTLWIQSIYRFVLDHLHDCVVIDMSHDIDDSSGHGTPLSDHLSAQDAIAHEDSYSVVDIIISMNPVANASSASDIQHIQVSSSGQAAQLLQPPHSDFGSFTMTDHIPDESFNQAFIQQLHSHNLRITDVSGDGLNCLINALIQHAKQDYQTDYFKEADMIREYLQQHHPKVADLTSMLHSDDHCAKTILSLVNDHCHATIQVVSVVIASSDGPIIYGGICDKRFSTGRHVVIWQQGNHYVSIVHHYDIVQTTSQHLVTDPDLQKASLTVPKLTQHQFCALEALGIVKKTDSGNYEICSGLDTIEHTLQSEKSDMLTKQDKEQVIGFLRLKLEIDFKTLNNSPRQLLTDLHHVLYDDLCQYGVIKPVKVKKDVKDIEQICHYAFGYKGRVSDQEPYFDVMVLNDYLKQKNAQELNGEQQSALVDYLQNHKIISRIVPLVSRTHRVLIKRDELTPHLMQSATHFTEAQQVGVKDYLLLMIQLQENVDTIISILKGHQSTIREVETPQITLRKLSDVFEDSMQDKGDVLGWFSDSQCDFIIDLGEQKWSWKTIFIAIGAIALGVAQIALGAVLLVTTAGTGSFFCNALISEGVSDMIFGIEGLVRGHCNWSQYWDNKKMSLAITVATAGLGAVFARGKEASKYAYKAFGNASKHMVKATAKSTGKSVSKVMAKQVAKKIGKKVAGAVVDAGINLATDAIVDQLSTGIDKLSDSIINCFDTMCHDDELQEKMSTFLQQQDPQDAGKYLHQITMRILQRRTFLDVLDDMENIAQKGASVVTQAHGQAASHLNMCGEKLKGKRYMKGISYISRFAPLVTETVKGGMIKIKMEKVKKALLHELEHQKVDKHVQAPLDEATINQIKKDEFAAMKHYLSQEVSQRGRKIVTTGIQLVSHELKKQTIKVGKEAMFAIKGHIDISKLNKYERKLEAAKSDENHSQIKKYERKLQRLMTRSRSPQVFARMIEHHDALLGPAFAVPALEKLVGRPIRIVTEDGQEVLNVQQHYGEGDVIEIKFVPGKDDQPGHYFVGEEIVAPQQHGNNCLINAVMAGAGLTDMNAGQVRKHIAEACRDSKHPCYDYIKRGIARNYFRIGVVGAGVVYFAKQLSGKAEWEPHMDVFLLNEWLSDPQNAAESRIDISLWKRGFNLTQLGLNRCHRLSEKSIHEMIDHAVSTKKVDSLRRLRKNLLPSIRDVDIGNSHFEGKARDAFLATYKGTGLGEKYMLQVRQVDEIITHWGTNMIQSEHVVKLAKNFSNSPLNVSLGHARTNQSVGKYFDYNPGTPRSKGLRKAFEGKHGYYPPLVTVEGGDYITSLYSGQRPSDT